MPSATGLPHSPGDVLIVDDALANLRLVSNLLKEHGYTVRCAPNGPTALMIAAAEPPDIILLDIVMPEMDGYEVCRRLKADPHTSQIPVIFLSARHATDDKIRGFELGSIDYITKPIEYDEVLARLGTHLHIQTLQRQLQTSNARLEHANQLLQQHTAALERTNQELQEFAHVVSHDLKAPLRGIAHLIQWLVTDYRAAFDAKGQEMTDLLLDRVHRLGEMIDGILRYSRAGWQNDLTASVALSDLLQEVLEMLAPPTSIQITVTDDLPVVTGDRTRLAQVFQNLIGNAIKYMDKPDGTVMIRCVDGGACWKFSITDNGPGIDPQDHTRIFQIFQTASAQARHDSTGIGLSIAKKIVDRYGGKIWVVSTPGQGSTFYFTLPKPARGSGQC